MEQLNSSKNFTRTMYKYLIVIKHPRLGHKEVSRIYDKLQKLAPVSQREFFDAWSHSNHSTIFLCEVKSIKEADNVVMILNDIRQNILPNPEHTIESNIITNVMRS